MPSSFTILFLITAFMAFLTWIIPAGQYEVIKNGPRGGDGIIPNSYHQIAPHTQGIWDIFMAPIKGVTGTATTEASIPIALFILVIGGFLGVVNHTNALDDGIRAVVGKFKGKEKQLIPILMIIFALGGSTYGMAEETLAIMPLLIPVMISVGFDSIVAISIILIGTQVGILASTINPFATGVASQSLGVSVGEGIGYRIVLWLIVVAISIIYVYRYASKIEKDPTKSFVYHQREADQKRFEINKIDHAVDYKMSKRQKLVLWLFGATFIVMIIGLIPWNTLNPRWDFFIKITHKIIHLPVIGELIGTDFAPLGTWFYPEMTMLFLFMSVMVMFAFKMPENEYVDSFFEGMKDFIGVAMIVIIARGIQVVMNDGFISATILHSGESLLKGLSASGFLIIEYLFYIPMTFLIPSSSGLAAATMGLIGPLSHFSEVTSGLVITAYQAAVGLVSLINPTTGLVVGALAIAHIDLATWWRYMAKLILILFIVTILFLLFATMI